MPHAFFLDDVADFSVRQRRDVTSAIAQQVQDLVKTLPAAAFLLDFPGMRPEVKDSPNAQRLCEQHVAQCRPILRSPVKKEAP